MSPIVNILADAMVAVLLVASIVSSVALSRRITRLKADESALRHTIGDLMMATETAERAIAGLRTTLGECDRTLAERLRVAERYAADLAGQVAAGEEVLGRIGRIVAQARPAAAPAPRAPETAPAAEVPAPARPVSNAERLGAAAAAARALSERALTRLQGQAA